MKTRIFAVIFITVFVSRNVFADGPLGERLIDDFEANNPYGRYIVYKEDNSSIDLYVSHKSKVDAGAMQVNYTLKSERNAPSSVEMLGEPRNKDWSDFEELRVWVKGDMSGNIFKIYLIDDDDEVWEFEDHRTLISGSWQRLYVNMESFVLTTSGNIGNKTLDLNNIREYAFIIKGKTPVETEGIIWIDDFAGAGPELPSRPLPIVGLPSGKLKVDVNISANAKFRRTPEASDEWYNEFLIKLTGQSANYSAYIELSPLFQEFGESVSQDEDGGYANADSWNQQGNSVWSFTKAEVANFAITITDLPHIASLQIGNLWIDYGLYAYSPSWGYKGIQADGRLEDALDYHTFIIKHRYDAYTLGSRLNCKIFGIEQHLIFVYSEMKAKLESSLSDISTVTSDITEIKTKRIFDDTVLLYEMSGRISDMAIITLSHALDRYNSGAYVDLSDPYNPVYKGERLPGEKISDVDFMSRGKLEVYPLHGTNIHYEFRDTGGNYLPRWRKDRSNFSNDYSNQQSHNIYFSQNLIYNFALSANYQDLTRKANPDYYRRSRKLGIMHKRYSGLELTFSREHLDDKNYHTDTRYNFNTFRNYDVYVNDLYISYEFSNDSKFYTKYSMWNGRDRGEDKEISDNSISLKGEKHLSRNASVSGEYIYTHYSSASDAPSGEPYDDNRILFEIKVNF